MTLETITDFATAAGLSIAAIALVLNLIQFRRLEKSIMGNTYQQLAQFALELKKILIDNPEIRYVYTQEGSQSRKQEVFDNLIGNYLEVIWLQRKYGLIDKEMWIAYDGLARELVKNHPNLVKIMNDPNYVKTLRDYVYTLSLEVAYESGEKDPKH